MKLFQWKSILFIAGVVAIFTLAGCGSGDEGTEQSDENGNAAEGKGETNYGEAIDYTITGIEPGAGISVNTEKALEEYDSLEGWEVNFSSTPAMISELDKAIKNEEPIIITGWTPHWIFVKYPDLKFLDDPKKVYGEADDIKKIARKGLKEEMPNAYKLLEQFELSIEELGKMMNELNKDKEPSTIAKEWIDNHPDQVKKWTEGVEKVDGKKFEIAGIPWDSDRINSNLVKKLLTDLGYEVTLTPVDVAVMYESVANGDADAATGVWMPTTHADFYAKYEDNLDDLGAIEKNARLGLVVPSYMDIDSIEDLQPKE